MKTVRQTVTIRESDFYKKLLPKSSGLYDRVTWQPYTVDQLKKDNLIAVLKNDYCRRTMIPIKSWAQYDDDRSAAIDIIRSQNNLYDLRYKFWVWTYNYFDDTVIVSTGRSNSQPSSMGIAILEKDLPG